METQLLFILILGSKVIPLQLFTGILNQVTEEVVVGSRVRWGEGGEKERNGQSLLENNNH